MKTLKLLLQALLEWVLLPAIVITSQSPFYIIISWLRWYIEFDFFPTYKSK